MSDQRERVDRRVKEVAMRRSALALTLGLLSSSAMATTYYVDYANGSDKADGKTTATAWQHAPGDLTGSGIPYHTTLVPGDVVMFRAGIVYIGMNRAVFNGQPGSPITYEGIGWGAGKAIMSGLTTVSATFTPYNGSPTLSVATLPSTLVSGTNGLDAAPTSNVVAIDGNVVFLSNNSPNPNPNFPDIGQLSYAPTDMVGSGKAWTFTDPDIATVLANASAAGTLPNITFTAFGASDNEYNLVIAGYNSATNALSLTGSFAPPSPASLSAFTLFNDPDFITAANPYPEYAIEGTQIITAVPPGVHTVGVSLAKAAFVTNPLPGTSHIVIDGFDMSGYGAGDGRAITATGTDIKVTNNTIHDLAFAYAAGLTAIGMGGGSNVVTGNVIGPHVRGGGGIFSGNETGDTISNNTIDSAEWTGIIVYNGINVSVDSNTIKNSNGNHANGIMAYDVNGTYHSNGVSITNNSIESAAVGCIAFEGDGSGRPDNFTVAYNVCKSTSGFGIADWGNTVGANVYGNIVITSADPSSYSLNIGRSTGVTYNGNIFSNFNNFSPPPANIIFTNNIALTTTHLLSPPAGGVGPVDLGAGNTGNSVNVLLAAPMAVIIGNLP